MGSSRELVIQRNLGSTLNELPFDTIGIREVHKQTIQRSSPCRRIAKDYPVLSEFIVDVVNICDQETHVFYPNIGDFYLRGCSRFLTIPPEINLCIPRLKCDDNTLRQLPALNDGEAKQIRVKPKCSVKICYNDCNMIQSKNHLTHSLHKTPCMDNRKLQHAFKDHDYANSAIIY